MSTADDSYFRRLLEKQAEGGSNPPHNNYASTILLTQQINESQTTDFSSRDPNLGATV